MDDTNLKSTFNDQGVEVDISAITIFDPEGRALVPTGFLFPEDESGNFDIFGRFDNVPPDSVENPLAINIDLEKVGRNGEGGNLTIQGKDGETIDVFNIDVIGDEDLPNSLGQILSSSLGTVNIATATESLGGDDFASLTVRGQDSTGAADDPFGGTVDTINAASFLGDLTIGTNSPALNVNTLTATGGGDVTFVAEITAGGEYSYVSAGGVDNFTVDLDGNAVDALGESFSLSTGDNDDTVTITMGAGVSQATMADLENLSVDLGADDDTLDLDNYGNFEVLAGSGDDTVYIANDGNNAARGAVAEVQTITFGAAGDLDTQGQVTVNFPNGTSVTTAGIATDATAATVASAVLTAITTAGLGAFGLSAASVTDDTLTLTYNPAGTDFANATVEGVLTDTTVDLTGATNPGETTTGVDGTDAADATKAVLVIKSDGTTTVPSTLTVTDGGGTTDSVTLADTDGNGVVGTVEFAQQVAGESFTDYVVTGSNETLGEVYLEAKVAGATSPTVVASGGGVTTPGTGTDNDGNTISAGIGLDAVGFSAGTAEVQTIEVTNGADQSGTVTMGIDVDADGTVDADESFTFNLTPGNRGEVAAQLATQIDALDGVSAAQGAAGTTIDDVIITWDLKTAADENADQAAADTTFVDGAIRSAAVVETTKGLVSAAGTPATWSVNDEDGRPDTPDTGNDDGTTELLFGARLTVTYSGATTSGASGVIAGAAIATSNGYESSVTVDTENSVGNHLNINAAITEAIEEDRVLDDLLSVAEGGLHSLAIESKIDGEFNEPDLAITMTAATFANLSTGQQSAIRAALRELDGDSDATYTDAQVQARMDDAVATYATGGSLDSLEMATSNGTTLLAGSASTTENNSSIDLGTGVDVLVLSTGPNSNNTLVYTGTENGKDTVVNFTETGSAADFIDFSAYLDGETSVSGSSVTAVQPDPVLNTDTVADLNEVTIINDFAQDLVDPTISSDDETWASLDNGKLLAALETTDSWGSIDSADLNVANITDLVGSTYSHIVMVENDLNDGEYKVFEVTATNNDEFTGVDLIGVVDFGDTLANVTDATFI